MVEKIVCKLVFDPNDPKSVSKTQQHFAKEVNINEIMKKYKKTGLLGNPLLMNGRKPFYGDFSQIKDLQTCLQVVNTAKAGWDRLSGDIKKKFNQNPVELVRFVQDPKNLVESVNLGLLPKELIPVPEVKHVDDQGNEIKTA